MKLIVRGLTYVLVGLAYGLLCIKLGQSLWCTDAWPLFKVVVYGGYLILFLVKDSKLFPQLGLLLGFAIFAIWTYDLR